MTRQQSSVADLLIRPQQHGDSVNRVQQVSRRNRVSNKNGTRNGHDTDDRPSKLQANQSQSSRSSPTQVWKTAQQLTFSDQATLNKVLNELQLSPDLRDSLKGDTLLDGTVSLQQLAAILDQALQADEMLSTDSKVSAADVGQLMQSLQSSQNGLLTDSNQLQLKAGGSYNLLEFRQLLQQVTQLSAQQRMPQNAADIGGDLGGTGSAARASAISLSGVVTGKLTSQPDTAGILLARSLLDDNTGDNGGVARQESLFANTGGKSGTTNPAAGPLGVPPGTGATGLLTPLNPGAVAGIEPSAINGPAQNQTDLAVGIASTGPTGITQSPTLGTSTGSQGISAPAATGSANNPAGSAAAAGSATPASAGMPLPTAMSLLKNAEGNGEAVIRSLHLEPENLRSGANQQGLTADSAAKQAIAGGLAERISAAQQTSAETTDNHDDQDQLSAFLRQGATVATAGNAAAAGHTPGTQASNLSLWSQALAERVREMQQTRQHQLTLEVDSKDLGRVTLRVETESNQVRAMISTESEQARDILNRSAPQLRLQLASQGLELGQLSVDVQSRKSDRDPVPQNVTSRDETDHSQSVTSPSQWLGSRTLADLNGPNTIINVFA